MLLTPLLGGPALRHPASRRLYTGALVVTAAAATAWMLAQYAFQVLLNVVVDVHLHLTLTLTLTLFGPSCALLSVPLQM